MFEELHSKNKDAVLMWGKAHSVAYSNWGVNLDVQTIDFDEENRRATFTWELTQDQKALMSRFEATEQKLNLLHEQLGEDGSGYVAKYEYSKETNVLTASFWAVSEDVVEEMLAARSNPLFSDFDKKTLANCELYVYYHTVRMDILLEGISFIGVWDDEIRQLTISVSDLSTNVEDGRIYTFDGWEEETRPSRIGDYFEECVRKIVLGEAEDDADPYTKWQYN